MIKRLQKIFTKIALGAFIIGLFIGPLPFFDTSLNKIEFTKTVSAEEISPSQLGIPCGIEDLSGCMATWIYSLVYLPSQNLVSLAARIMDSFLYLSISDFTYRSPIIEEGWRILRDFTNIFFIFAIIYAAISMILGTGGGGKSIVVKVLIIATLINFSLFAGKLIVDFGNIFAFALYEQINVVSTGNTEAESVKAIGTGFLSISNPSKILSTIGSGAQADIVSVFATLVMFGIIFNLMIAWLFFKTAFFFLKRIVGIYVALIFSPFAFVSYAMPPLITQNLESFNLNKWLSGLFKMSISAGFFLLMIYLAINFMTAGLSIGMLPTVDDQLGQILFSFTLTFALTFAFLTQGSKFVERAVAEVSSVVDKWVGKAAGAALGLGAGAIALGASGLYRGARFLGSNSKISNGLNRFASKGDNKLARYMQSKGFGGENSGKTVSEIITMNASKGGMVSRNLMRLGNRLDKSSFDVRQNKLIGGNLEKLSTTFLGTNVNANDPLLASIGMNVGGKFTRSLEDTMKARRERQERWAKSATLQGERKKLHDARAAAANEKEEVREERRKNFDEAVENIEEEIINEAETRLGRFLTEDEKNNYRLSSEERKRLHKKFIEKGEINDMVMERTIIDATTGRSIGKTSQKNLRIINDRKGRINYIDTIEDGYVRYKKELQNEAAGRATNEVRKKIIADLESAGVVLNPTEKAEILRDGKITVAGATYSANNYANLKAEQSRAIASGTPLNNTQEDEILNYNTLNGAALTNKESEIKDIAKKVRETGKYQGEKLENHIASERFVNAGTAEERIKALEEMGITLTPEDKKELEDFDTLRGKDKTTIANDLKNLGMVADQKIKSLENTNGFFKRRWKMANYVNSAIINKYVAEKREYLKDDVDFLTQTWAELNGWRDGVLFFTGQDGAGRSALFELSNQFGSGVENIQRVTQLRDELAELDKEVFGRIKQRLSQLDDNAIVDAAENIKGNDLKEQFANEVRDASSFTSSDTRNKERYTGAVLAMLNAEIEASKERIKNGGLSPLDATNERIKLKSLETEYRKIEKYDEDRVKIERAAADIAKKLDIDDK